MSTKSRSPFCPAIQRNPSRVSPRKARSTCPAGAGGRRGGGGVRTRASEAAAKRNERPSATKRSGAPSRR